MDKIADDGIIGIIGLFGIIVLFFSVLILFEYYSEPLPTVSFTVDEKCVEVRYEESLGDCSDMPRRYHKQYVSFDYIGEKNEK